MLGHPTRDAVRRVGAGNLAARSGLIERWKQGRVNYCRLVPHPLTQAADWIQQHKAFWERQFDALADYLDREQADELRNHRR